MFTKKLSNLLMLVMLSMTSLAVHAVEVTDAWVREAPPGAKMLGGFMTLSNHSAKDVMLTGASSKSFKHIMLHRTIEEDGVSKMVHQHMVRIPAHGKVEFKPGDYHIMMPASEKRLLAGDKVMVTLKFKSGKTVDVEFTVRKAMAMKHNGGGHNKH